MMEMTKAHAWAYDSDWNVIYSVTEDYRSVAELVDPPSPRDLAILVNAPAVLAAVINFLVAAHHVSALDDPNIDAMFERTRDDLQRAIDNSLMVTKQTSQSDQHTDNFMWGAIEGYNDCPEQHADAPN